MLHCALLIITHVKNTAKVLFMGAVQTIVCWQCLLLKATAFNIAHQFVAVAFDLIDLLSTVNAQSAVKVMSR